MRKLPFAVLLLSLFFLVGCSNKGDEYRVVVMTALTGEGANYGRSTSEGVELAVEQLNQEKYLDKPMVIQYEDDRMSPKDGINAINQVAARGNLPVVIGPFGSSVVLAVAPVAERHRIVVITASATADAIADAGDYIFRITPPNSRQGYDIADFAVSDLKAKNAAILYQNNDYGVTLRDGFKNRFEELGGTIGIEEGMELGDLDFRTQILKIRNKQPDIVFFPLHYKESGSMLKQAGELGLKTHFISADGAMTADLLKIAGDAAEGTYYSTLALGYGVADDQISKFTTEFKEKYRKEPDIYASYYYEVTNLIADAIKHGGYTSDGIKNYLYTVHGDNAYQGITGKTSFDDRGEVDKSFYIYQVRDGQFELCQ